MTRIIPLLETTDPAAVPNNALIYSKDVAGVTRVFARLSDGTIVEMSSGGGGGSDLLIADDGVNVPNTPHTRLDFAGPGVAVTDAGGGTALVTIPGGSPGTMALPEQWSRISIAPSLDEPMSALVSQSFDSIAPIRNSSVVGLRARLSQAFDAGTVTITVTINGVPGTLQLTFTAGQTTAFVTQAGGIDSFTTSSLLGLNIQSSGDWSVTGTCDVEAWLEVETAGGGGGGGGGSPWLQLDPVVKNTTFTAVPGYVHQLGAPGKGAQIQLPVSALGTDVVAFKIVDPSYGWSINGGTVDGVSFWTPSPQDGWVILLSAGDGASWYRLSSNRVIRIQNSGGPNPTPTGDQQGIGQMDFYYPIVVDASIGAGRAQIYIDQAALAPPSSHVQLTYWPGSGLTGPTIFDNFGTLSAAIDALRGTGKASTFDILFNDSTTSPAVVPSGIYNMTGVTWRGYNRPFSGTSNPGVYVEVQEGVQFYDLGNTPNFGQLKKITDHLHVTFTGTTPPNVYTNAFPSNIPGLFLELDRGSSIRCTGGGPFFDFTTVAFNGCFLRMDGGAFRGGTYEVVRFTGSWSVQIYLDGHPYDVAINNNLIDTNTLRGNAGAALNLFIMTEQVTVSETQANLVNPVIAFPNVHRRVIDLQNVGGGSVAATQSVTVMNASAPTNATILDTCANNRGLVRTIKSSHLSAAAITVVPSGGDTIDGAANYPLPVANNSVTLISDGISNWVVIAAT